jgi:hypothetical protein
MVASYLAPTNGSKVVSYTSGNRSWQNFVMDRVQAGEKNTLGGEGENMV